MITSDTRNRVQRQSGPRNSGRIRRDLTALTPQSGDMAHDRGICDRRDAIADALTAFRSAFA
jgi:hypothetical protein